MVLWRDREIRPVGAYSEDEGPKDDADLLSRAQLGLPRRFLAPNPRGVLRIYHKMFPKKYRLPLGKKRVFEKTLSTPHFVLKTSRNRIGKNRLGMIISNAAVKKSVRRHFWKRKFSGLIRLWPNLERDFLIIVSSKIESLPPKDLKKELEKILELLI